MQEGITLQNSNNPTGAIVLFKNALERDPNYYEARLQLGLAYLAWGNNIQAEKELEKVLLQDPKNGEVLLHLATVHLNNQAPDKAIQRVELYLKEHPATPLAFELLGNGFAQKGNTYQAEEAYQKALQLNPSQRGARNGLALLYGSTGRMTEARNLLQKSLELDQQNMQAHYLLLQLEGSAGNLAEAIEVGKRLLKLFPDEIRAAYLLGILEISQGDSAAAGQLATDLTTRFPDHPAGVRLQGLVLYTEGKYAEAVEKLQRTVQQVPDLAGRYILGLTHYQLGDFELALNQFQAVLDEKPEHHQARLMVAQTLFRQKRFDDSRTAIDLVLKAEPNNALARDILGSIYLAQGDYDRGMVEIDKAITLAPNLVDAQLKKGLFNLTQGNLEQAEAPLEEVVRLAPELLNSRLLLAVSYLRRQNFDQAIITLQEGLQNRPEDAVLHNHLAVAYLGQGKEDAAVAQLEKAKQRKPDYLAPYVNMANYHLAQGHPVKAAAEYQSMLKIDPQNLQALLSLAALQELQGNKEGAQDAVARAMATKAVEGFVAQALYQNRNDQSEQALATLQAGLQIYPKHPGMLELQGRTLLHLKRGEEAMATFKSLTEVQPDQGLPLQIATLVGLNRHQEAIELAKGLIDQRRDSVQGYQLLSAVHQQQKDYRQAEAVLLDGSRKVKNDLPLQMKLAELYLAQRQTDKALQLYRQLYTQHPQNLGVAFSLASLQDQLGDKRQALELYRACLDINSDYVPALNNLAYLYANNYQNLDEALQLAVRAFKQKPTEPGIMDTLGYVLIRKERFGEALPYLEKSASLLPKDATIQLHLSLAYQGLGKHEKAEKYARKVIASGNPLLVQSAETLLAQLKKSEKKE